MIPCCGFNRNACTDIHRIKIDNITAAILLRAMHQIYTGRKRTLWYQAVYLFNYRLQLMSSINIITIIGKINCLGSIRHHDCSNHIICDFT